MQSPLYYSLIACYYAPLLFFYEEKFGVNAMVVLRVAEYVHVLASKF